MEARKKIKEIKDSSTYARATRKLVGFKIGEFARPRFKDPAVRPLHTYLRS